MFRVSSSRAEFINLRRLAIAKMEAWKFALRRYAGHAGDSAYAAVAVPYFCIELSSHRPRREDSIVIARGFNHAIAQDSALRIDAVDLVFPHATLA
jgi:hypothetical protein